MDINFLSEYVNLIVLGICLCVGYVLKNIVAEDRINKFIPLIMLILGTVLSVWIAGELTPSVVLTGMFSGLASTGMHQLFTKLIKLD